MSSDVSIQVPQQAAESIAARDLHLSYPNGVQALRGISLRVACGEFVAVIGPNGSGKSSLLRALAGLQPLDSGEVRLAGDSLASLDAIERARRIALVPQSLEIMPGYSVQDFVLMGRYAHLTGWRLYSKHDREVALECLKNVDAQSFVDRSMNEMSGGERQRVLIARALAQEARAILLDEPTSSLDLKHQLLVYRLIHDMHRGGQRAIVVVTHDLNLASQFAERLILLRQGKIAAEGTPAQVLRRDILNDVYETDLAYGEFEETISGHARPWVLPWAKFK